MNGKIALVVQGLFELSDSIGYDCVGQYLRIRERCAGKAEVRIFAEHIDAQRHKGISIADIDQLWPWLQGDPDAAVIYHYCDGWPSFEIALASLPARLIVRWHNNTPPWFVARYTSRAVARTIRGYNGIFSLANLQHAQFWANSSYSARQLALLGIDESRIQVVYPISTFLNDAASPPRDGALRAATGADPIKILFVGRVVPHKGHKHMIAACGLAQKATGRRMELAFAGRSDSGMLAYIDEIKSLAADLGVGTTLCGEVEADELNRLYAESHVFLCLSEHEGFGLPIFEAMRLGLPVVGLCSTAIADFLSRHPLSVGAIDYPEIALRLLAAVDPDVRRAVVEWQRRHLLAHYDDTTVTRQIMDGLAGNQPWPVIAPATDDSVVRTLDELKLRLWPKLQSAASTLLQIRYLPRDLPDRMITRYDIEAYATLLATTGADRIGDFYDSVMKTRFDSARPVIGPVLTLARRAALSLQSGLIEGMNRLNGESRAQFERIDSAIGTLKVDVTSLRNAVDNLTALHAANVNAAAPPHDASARVAPDVAPSQTVPDARSKTAQAELS